MTAPNVRLEVVAGRATGMWILLDDELLIGRHADGAGRLADDDEISRSHARVSLDRSGFCAIEDLGSTNGTYVNGLRITSPHTLSIGDTIEVGATTLVVRDLPIAATERSPKAVPPQPTIVPGDAIAERVTEASQMTPSGRRRSASEAPPRMPSDLSPTSNQSASTPREPRPPQDQARPADQISFRLEIDFAARRAIVSLEDGSAPLRLEFDGEGWRPAAS